MAIRGKEHRGDLRTIDGGRGEIVIYQPGEGGGRLEVRLEQDSLWLSLNQIAAVFEQDKSVISRHLNNVFREGELDRRSTVAFFATVQDEGGRMVLKLWKEETARYETSELDQPFNLCKRCTGCQRWKVAVNLIKDGRRQN